MESGKISTIDNNVKVKFSLRIDNLIIENISTSSYTTQLIFPIFQFSAVKNFSGNFVLHFRELFLSSFGSINFTSSDDNRNGKCCVFLLNENFIVHSSKWAIGAWTDSINSIKEMEWKQIKRDREQAIVSPELGHWWLLASLSFECSEWIGFGITFDITTSEILFSLLVRWSRNSSAIWLISKLGKTGGCAKPRWS